MSLNFQNPVFLASQILMAVAAILIFSSFQFKKGETFRWLFVIAGIFAGIHYLLLGAVTAALIVFVSALRWFVSVFTKRAVFLYIFINLMIGVTFFSYRTVFSIIPLTAGIIGTVAIFHKNELRTRELLLIVSLLWLTYNSILFTPVGIISEVLFFASGVIGYLRLKGSFHKVRSR